MRLSEESDSGIVPMNHSNKIEQSMAESEEGRPLIKENIHQPSTRPTQSGARVSQGAGGCAESEFLIASPPIIRDKSRMR
jgi:RNA-directed DNA polymerase